LAARIDKGNWTGQSPMIDPPAIEYEMADRVQAVSVGGIGVVQELAKRLDLAETINRHCPIFKLRLPYSEADHVLNIAYNLLAGGCCLDHLEVRRTDEAYLNALGAQRIPDPTTAGDFCRRFGSWEILCLQDAFHEAGLKAWREQPESFFDEAVIEADGTMVETQGERKEGIGMNYKKQWGYHPLLVTLANTREVLYLVNRSGNRPSHEGASGYFDRAIKLCRKAGFKRIKLRGDTDFSQTQFLDGWDEEGIRFVFGMDANPTLVKLAEELPKSAWTKLERPRTQAEKPRARRPNYREEIVVEKKYENKRLQAEFVAEFEYRPGKCRRAYRIVVLRKDVQVTIGEQKLFDDSPYFFYITNITEVSTAEIVFEANQRCDQENIHSQLKEMGALAAPLDSLNSNWAYMVIATLAWNLKCWMGLALREKGNEESRKQRRAEKHRILRMDFTTFRQYFMLIPTQIVRTARKLVYRVLAWNPYLEVLLRLKESVSQPLLC
jgi:hypothetical protein